MNSVQSMSARSVRVPVVLVSIAFAFVLSSFAIQLMSGYLTLQGDLKPADLESFQSVLRIERYVFWAAAVVLVAIAASKIWRQRPDSRNSGTLRRGYTVFLFVAAFLLVLMVIPHLTRSSEIDSNEVYGLVLGLVVPCYLMTAMAAVVVAVLRMRLSAYATSASTAVLVFLLFAFAPIGIVGCFFWRSDRNALLNRRST